MCKKGFCIICRKDEQEMSDEHVIPEAIGGYYHIYSVCKTCNSKLGDHIDKLLLNHWFIKASRYEKGLKGYSGKIPNPLIGEGTLSTGEKVRVEQDDDGKMSIRLIPSKIASSDGRSFKIQVDAKDENTILQIQTKILKRNNIDPSMSQLVSERQVVNIDHPEVKMQFTIDLEEYILGLLKIAYEFARKNNKERVSIVTKANIIKTTDGKFLNIAKKVAEEYPEITTDEWFIDIMTAKLVDEKRRGDFKVFILPNLYGDIITDEAAEFQGGVGTAGSANIGKKYAMFEAIHGSAPRMVNEGRAIYADPCSMLRAAVLLLSHIGYQKEADKLASALDICMFEEKRIKVTGRNTGATCEEFTAYVKEKL